MALTASTLHGQTVITFEEFPFPSGFFPGTSLSSEGFVIHNLGSLPAEITPCDPPCPDNGTQYLLTQFDGLLRLTNSTGHDFSLVSFDAGESFSGLPSFWASQIVLTGEVLGGGTVQASFSLDFVNDGPGPLNDFQTFVLPPTFRGLTALTITGSGSAVRDDFSLDNLRLTVVLDSDGDGVPDDMDQCPNTPAGAIVDRHGCSIDQLVPCAGPPSGGPWRNHGRYVSSVAKTAEKFLAAGLITEDQAEAIVEAAAKSNCGKKRKRRHINE